MKVRIELQSAEAIEKSMGNFYVRLSGSSADAPGRKVIAVAGPYKKERCDDLMLGLMSDVPAGVQISEAGLICDVIGVYIDRPAQVDEPANVIKLLATAVTPLRNAEVVLYRQYKRFCDMLQRLQSMEGVPAPVMQEIESYAVGCGWSTISFESLLLEDVTRPRIAEEVVNDLGVEVQRSIVPEEAAAEKLGLHTRFDPQVSFEQAPLQASGSTPEQPGDVSDTQNSSISVSPAADVHGEVGAQEAERQSDNNSVNDEVSTATSPGISGHLTPAPRVNFPGGNRFAPRSVAPVKQVMASPGTETSDESAPSDHIPSDVQKPNEVAAAPVQPKPAGTDLVRPPAFGGFKRPAPIATPRP